MRANSVRSLLNKNWHLFVPITVLLLLVFWTLIPSNVIYFKASGQSQLGDLLEQKAELEDRLLSIHSNSEAMECEDFPTAPLEQDHGKYQRPGVHKTRSALLESLEESVVLILNISETSQHIISHGSGFFITENQILTNGHVVMGQEENARIFIINESLGLHEAHLLNAVVAEDIGKDFAILTTDFAFSKPLPLRVVDQPRNLKLKSVFSAGYPGSVIESDLKFHQLIEGTLESAPDLVVTDGVISASQNMFGEIEAHIHTAQISGGNSGGPLVDQCGAVVGLNTYVRSDEAGVRNIAISSREVFRYLQKQKISPLYYQTECD